MLNLLAGFIERHPVTEAVERALDKDKDLTCEDLKVIIKKDKLNVVTGEAQGLKNFEAIISTYLDTIDTRLRDFYNNTVLKELEIAKQSYLQGSVKDICNGLT
jgi:hypothetical protein